jgi:hypothetical protein
MAFNYLRYLQTMKIYSKQIKSVEHRVDNVIAGDLHWCLALVALSGFSLWRAVGDFLLISAFLPPIMLFVLQLKTIHQIIIL